jgi:hypothetical protein
MTTTKAEIELGPLSIKLRRSADAENWNVVRVGCRGNYGDAWVEGNILMPDEIENWLRQVKAMNKTLAGDATLESIEPGIKLSMHMDKLGRIDVSVEITGFAGNEYELHRFSFVVDQSYLPATISQADSFLKASRAR